MVTIRPTMTRLLGWLGSRDGLPIADALGEAKRRGAAGDLGGASVAAVVGGWKLTAGVGAGVRGGGGGGVVLPDVQPTTSATTSNDL
jgi:hypothetical protein